MNITQSFVSNIKKNAKNLQKKLGVKHTQALEIAAKEAGFPNYHALQTRVKRENDHKANIVNANKGMKGVNREFSLAQGNRGKQLNPNYQSSLLVVFNDDLLVNELEYENGKPKFIQLNFHEHYLDKGFAEEIGARPLGLAELKKRNLDLPEGGKLHNWGYICIEFLRNKDNPWVIEDANEFVKKRMEKTLGSIYREFFFIDDKYEKNHISESMQASVDFINDEIFYCPSIDGY
jgi:hypothetical protein